VDEHFLTVESGEHIVRGEVAATNASVVVQYQHSGIRSASQISQLRLGVGDFLTNTRSGYVHGVCSSMLHQLSDESGVLRTGVELLDLRHHD